MPAGRKYEIFLEVKHHNRMIFTKFTEHTFCFRKRLQKNRIIRQRYKSCLCVTTAIRFTQDGGRVPAWCFINDAQVKEGFETKCDVSASDLC